MLELENVGRITLSLQQYNELYKVYLEMQKLVRMDKRYDGTPELQIHLPDGCIESIRKATASLYPDYDVDISALRNITCSYGIFSAKEKEEPGVKEKKKEA